MPNLLYIVNQRIPTEKAYGIQIAKMCEALADAGLEVTLVAPRRGKGTTHHNVFEYYSIRRNFKARYLTPPDFYLPGKLDFLAFWVKNIISSLWLARYAVKIKPDIIYSRDELPLFFVSFLNNDSKIVFEAHKFSKFRKSFYGRFRKKDIKIVAITKGLANEFFKRGFKPNYIWVAADGVDASTMQEAVERSIGKEDARRRLGLPMESRTAVYTGSLYRWKGVYTLADAAKLLPDINFIVVGGGQGEDEFREYLVKNHIKNVLLTGYVRDDKKLRLYLACADVLLLPNTAKGKLSELYTSPLKLFEYMASLRPIVASDLSSIREVLNESMAVLVKPDDPRYLADGIKTILESPAVGERLSSRAFENAKQYTWQKRAELILGFLRI